ncbi:uncharacterized protein [Epargyreus clarus]|uniref:uncharacterized protein n=1 Tax=Epargyreus clarus TaxID=520877 RepID=UPI003C2CEF3F
MSNSSIPIPEIKNLNTTEIDKYIETLTTNIQKACNKTLKPKKNKIKNIPWWNDELEHLKRRVVFFHHRIQDLKRKNKSLENILVERQNIKEEYKLMLFKVSTEHFRNFCNRQGKEDVWSLTNRLLKCSPQPTPPTTLKLGNNQFTKSSEDSASALLDKFYPIDNPDWLETQKNLRTKAATIPETPNEVDFTTEEVMDCISSMNPGKAPGPDHLTADICSKFTETFPEIIPLIMNRCLQLAHFPTSWKQAFVKTLPKPNKLDCNDISSYRPIGLLDIFGKVLEKLVAKRLIHHLNITNNLHKNQFGFREQKSTTDALAQAVTQINNAKRNGKMVIAVSLDIKGAFDHAWWPALLNRLHDVKCPSNLYRIIQSYLSNRSVALNYADATVHRNLSRGCVQGSVLGPLFWNLIVDELLCADLPPNCHLQAFADDLLLITSANNTTELENDTNAALKTITEWGRKVKLEFASSKTQAIAFTVKATKSAAIALADFTPIELKIKEIAEFQLTKRTGYTKYLPQDITYDRPTHPSNLLHPAQRIHISFDIINNQDELDERVPLDTTRVYTDGSKHDGLVGAAFVAYHPDGNMETRKLKLHSCCSVFQAELLAIQKALEYCAAKGFVRITILSDSKSALLEIQNCNSTNSMVAEIHKLTYNIQLTGLIEFVWVRSHIGLIGNEAADQAAKAAASLHSSPDFANFPISFAKYHLKLETDRLTDDRYRAETKGAHTRLWCPSINTIKELYKYTEPTFQLTQILSGHGYHLQYLHRFKITSTDKCPCDEISIQSIDHLLKQCPVFGNERLEHEFICNNLNIEAYNLSSLITNESSILSFINLSNIIINKLKKINDT